MAGGGKGGGGQDSSNENVEQIKKAMKKAGLDAYKITLIVIFVVQILFCMMNVCYTRYQIHEVEQATIKQQAKQYNILYNFHQKLLVVEEEMEKEKAFNT